MDKTNNDTNTIRKFNKHLENLINELQLMFPSNKNQFTHCQKDVQQNYYLLEFKKNITKYLDLLIKNDLNLIYKPLFNNIVLENIHMIENIKIIIYKYIIVMYIECIRYQKTKEELNSIIKNKNNTNKEHQAFLVAINSLKKYRMHEKKQNNEQNNEQINNFMNLNNDIINNSSIGKIAMDIAKDINMDNIKLDKPDEMLQNLMSGNISQNNNLHNLINTVSNKITEKFSNGEIDTNNIMTDATKLFNNPLFKNMSNLSNQDIMPTTASPPTTPTIAPTTASPLTQQNKKKKLINNLKKVKQKYLKKKIKDLLKK